MQPLITVLGNVATQPQRRQPVQGQHLTQFRLAQTQRKRDFSGNWVDGATSWYDVTCWRGPSHNVFASLNKGDPVIVVGRLRINEWEKDGRTGRDAVIDAIAIGPDLRRGISRFTKVKREQPEQIIDSDDYVLELSRMADAELLSERAGADGGSPDGGEGEPEDAAEQQDAAPFGSSDAQQQAA